jgi:hypothetical protein
LQLAFYYTHAVIKTEANPAIFVAALELHYASQKEKKYRKKAYL